MQSIFLYSYLFLVRFSPWRLSALDRAAPRLPDDEIKRDIKSFGKIIFFARHWQPNGSLKSQLPHPSCAQSGRPPEQFDTSFSSVGAMRQGSSAGRVCPEKRVCIGAETSGNQ